MAPSPSHEIMAGVVSGVVDALATHPIDQVKTQAHVRSGGGPGPSMLSSLVEQARAGGISRLYRGVGAACLRPQSLFMYTGNEWCKRVVVGKDNPLTHTTAPIAGFLTGYAESAAVTPFEVVKVRMQSKEHIHRYRSSIHCAYTILANEGPQALCKGFGATCARNCTFNGVFFGSVFVMKDALQESKVPLGDIGLNLTTGMAGGLIATCFKQPFDVMKSRIQNQIPDALMEKKYRNTLQALALTAREEGLAALYKGFVPTATRMMLGQCVALTAFEFTLSQLQHVPQNLPSTGTLAAKTL